MINVIGLTLKTVKDIQSVLDRAEDGRREIVQRCRDFLEAARMAIIGLWQVYDGILVDAEIVILRKVQTSTGCVATLTITPMWTACDPSCGGRS